MSESVTFRDVSHIILPILIKLLYVPTKYKIFRIKSVEPRYYTRVIELGKYIDYPIENDNDVRQYPIKESLYNISSEGSGRLGCKIIYLYIRRTFNLKEFMKSLKVINKIFSDKIDELLVLKSLEKNFLIDNLNYKIFLKKFYDKHPNYYKTYCQCDTNLPDEYHYRNWHCQCYHSHKCDLCSLTGEEVQNRYYGDIIQCKICKYELSEKRREYWEYKKESWADDY